MRTHGCTEIGTEDASALADRYTVLEADARAWLISRVRLLTSWSLICAAARNKDPVSGVIGFQ